MQKWKTYVSFWWFLVKLHPPQMGLNSFEQGWFFFRVGAAPLKVEWRKIYPQFP